MHETVSSPGRGVVGYSLDSCMAYTPHFLLWVVGGSYSYIYHSPLTRLEGGATSIQAMYEALLDLISHNYVEH